MNVKANVLTAFLSSLVMMAASQLHGNHCGGISVSLSYLPPDYQWHVKNRIAENLLTDYNVASFFGEDHPVSTWQEKKAGLVPLGRHF